MTKLDCDKTQNIRSLNGLEIQLLQDEIKQLELDLEIHEEYQGRAEPDDLMLNEYLINKAKNKLSQLLILQNFEK